MQFYQQCLGTEGASKGVAPCRFDSSSSSFSSTNRNSASEATNRLISQGQATRSTFTSLRVIHFMFTSRSPRICDFDGESIFIKLWWVGGNQTGETLSGRIDHEQITVGTVIPAKTNVGDPAAGGGAPSRTLNNSPQTCDVQGKIGASSRSVPIPQAIGCVYVNKSRVIASCPAFAPDSLRTSGSQPEGVIRASSTVAFGWPNTR